MIHINKPTFVETGSLAADFTSDVIDTQGALEINFDISIPATGTPNGVLYLLVAGDKNKSFGQFYLDANKVYGEIDGAVYAHAGGAALTITGSAATFLHIPIVGGIPKCFKVFWDRTSGTGSIAVGYVLKGD